MFFRRAMSLVVTTLFFAAEALAEGPASTPVVPERPYAIEIHPGFTSEVSFEDVESVAIRTHSKPLDVEGEGANIRFVGLPPTITRIVGCQTADLDKVDKRITPPDDLPAVWVVQLRGDFVARHVGELKDADAYLLVHTKSGMVLQAGVFGREDQ